MQRAVAAAFAAEKEDGVLAVSIFAGFPLSDFRDAGMSVVVVADGDAALADQVAEKIARQMWNERQGFSTTAHRCANRWRMHANWRPVPALALSCCSITATT